MAHLTFDNGQPILKAERSAFDLSNEYDFDVDYSRCVPVDFHDCIPGDNFNMSNRCLIRTNPLIKPAFTFGLKGKFRSFFVPYRIVYQKFEKMFTGGRSGNAKIPMPVINYKAFKTGDNISDYTGTLFDYFRLPNPVTNVQNIADFNTKNFYINAFYFLAYIQIWNDYFRNTTLDYEINLYDMELYLPNDDEPIDLNASLRPVTLPDGSAGVDYTGVVIVCMKLLNAQQSYSRDDIVQLLNKDPSTFTEPHYLSVLPFVVNSPRDYFTSALPTPQLGVRTTIPVNIGGTVDIQGNARFDNDITASSYPEYSAAADKLVYVRRNNFYYDPADSTHQLQQFNINSVVNSNDLNNNTLNITSSIINAETAGFYPEQLRLSFALDLRQQILGLSGTRYLDALESMYGFSPNSDVLQMAEFIGGYNLDIFTSEVIQTSSTTQDSSLGNLAGHGIGSDSNEIGNYLVQEPGCIITLFYINSKTLYSQGIRRDYLKYSINDFFFPMFTNLGEQEVYRCELVHDFNDTADYNGNLKTYGYQARYNDYRYVPDCIGGTFRTSNLVWTQAKFFAQPTDDSNTDQLPIPVLNQSSIKMPISQANRIFNNITTEGSIGKNFQVRLYNVNVAYRPLPSQAIGSMIDHFGL